MKGAGIARSVAAFVDHLTNVGERLTPYAGKKYHFVVRGKIVHRGATSNLAVRERQLRRKWPHGRIVELGKGGNPDSDRFSVSRLPNAIGNPSADNGHKRVNSVKSEPPSAEHLQDN